MLGTHDTRYAVHMAHLQLECARRFHRACSVRGGDATEDLQRATQHLHEAWLVRGASRGVALRLKTRAISWDAATNRLGDALSRRTTMPKPYKLAEAILRFECPESKGADMARIKGTPLSKLNWHNAPGPGDLGNPPEDEPTAVCEECGDEFEFDPKDYTSADEDGECYDGPPELCIECQAKRDQFEAINQYIDATAQCESVQFIIEQGLGWDYAEELKAAKKAEA